MTTGVLEGMSEGGALTSLACEKVDSWGPLDGVVKGEASTDD